MSLIVVVSVLALLGILANGFGADSRETVRAGWIVERWPAFPAAARADTAGPDRAATAPALGEPVARRALHKLAA
jgi:hypothetical protein